MPRLRKLQLSAVKAQHIYASTFLEKSLQLLKTLPDNEVEKVYSYIQFICTQQTNRKYAETENWMDKAERFKLPDLRNQQLPKIVQIKYGSC